MLAVTRGAGFQLMSPYTKCWLLEYAPNPDIAAGE
jgi:hypothetical protein